MSYPAPSGYGSNLAADVSLQRSTDTFNFVLNTGGGANASTLESPAQITPDATGTVSLTMDATGTANSVLTISTPGTGAAVLNLTNTGTGPSVINMGPLGEGVSLAVENAFPNALAVKDPATGNTVAQIDVGINNIVLGDITRAGDVVTGASLTVSNDLGGIANAIRIQPATAITGVISQTVADTGLLSIGSSAAFPSILQLSDDGAEGAAVVGGNIGSGIQLKGGLNPRIIANVGNSGRLLLGSSSDFQDQIVLTDTSITVGSTVNVAPIFTCMTARVALAPAPGPSFAYGSGTRLLPLSGLPDGMYSLMVYPVPGSAGPTDLLTLGACFTTMFIMKTGLCVYGGCGQNSSGDVRTFPSSGLATITFNIIPVGNYYLAIDFFQMAGAVPGV